VGTSEGHAENQIEQNFTDESEERVEDHDTEASTAENTDNVCIFCN
jgi:hypothetical protein